MNIEPSQLSPQNISTLLRDATSAGNLSRHNSLNYLRQLQKMYSDQFIMKLIELLKSADKDIRILAFSYLKHEVVDKLKRSFPHLVRALEETHYFFDQLEVDVQYQKDNVIMLQATLFSKAGAQRDRNQYLTQNIPILVSTNILKKRYIRHLIKKMVQILPVEERRKTLTIHCFVQNMVFELFRRGQLEDIQCAIDLSYFLALFPQELWQQLNGFLSELNSPVKLKLKILNRLNTALTVQVHIPNFINSFNIYTGVKRIALGLKRGQVDEQVLVAVTGILQRTLFFCLKEDSKLYLSELFFDNIWNSQQFHLMLTWLLQISANSQYEDDSDKMLNKKTIEILILLSENMPEELTYYFQQMFNNLHKFKQQQLLFFLSGAPRKIHQMFNADQVLNNLITQTTIPVPLSSNVRFLFVQRYVKNNYYIDYNVFCTLEKYLMFMIRSYEQCLSNQKISKDEEIQVMIKLSILLGTYMLMSKYPRVSVQRALSEINYIQYVSSNVFKYLTNSVHGLPQLAHQKLYESLLEVVGIGNQLYSEIICSDAIKIYYGEYISMGDMTKEKQRSTSKIRQEMLSLIRQTLTLVQFKQENTNLALKMILVSFDPDDLGVTKEVLFLLGKYMKIYNTCLVSQSIDVIKEQTNSSKDYISFQFASVIQDIFFTSKLHQFQALLQGNLDYDLVSGIDSLLQDFFDALQVLIELSVHKFCFDLVEDITLKLIKYIQSESHVIDQLCQLSKKKMSIINNSVKRLRRLSTYLDCLVETLYLNPLWQNSQYMTERKYMIIQTLTFRTCKQRVDDFVGGDITKMLAQISIDSQPQKTLDRWDKVYFDLLGDSGIGQLCQLWINNLKFANDM